MKLKKGEIYNVHHSRKGKFKIQLKSEDLNWITGVIIEGETDVILIENKQFEGEEVTIRKSLCTLSNSN